MLKSMGFNDSTVKNLKTLYKDQQAAVRVGSEVTNWFKIGTGVRQGCLISPLSFNCYSEYVMNESVNEFIWIGVTISNRTKNNLRYADDIVLIATSEETLQTLIDKLSKCFPRVWIGDQHKEYQSIGGINQGNYSPSYVCQCLLKASEGFSLLGQHYVRYV